MMAVSLDLSVVTSILEEYEKFILEGITTNKSDAMLLSEQCYHITELREFKEAIRKAFVNLKDVVKEERNPEMLKIWLEDLQSTDNWFLIQHNKKLSREIIHSLIELGILKYKSYDEIPLAAFKELDYLSSNFI